MYHKILETDEAINDLKRISCSAYTYTRDKGSGITFLQLYDTIISAISFFPEGFSTTSLEYLGYAIHIFPFGNYNLFYVICKSPKRILILRVLYQKQNWQKILKVDNSYHIHGKKS